MRQQFKLASLALLASSTSAISTTNLAGLTSKFHLNSETNSMETETIADDFLSLIEYFGIDGKSTWMFSGNPK